MKGKIDMSAIVGAQGIAINISDAEISELLVHEQEVLIIVAKMIKQDQVVLSTPS